PTPPPGVYTLPLPDALPILGAYGGLATVLKDAGTHRSSQLGRIEVIPQTAAETLGHQQVGFVVNPSQLLTFFRDHCRRRTALSSPGFHIAQLLEQRDNPVEGCGQRVSRLLGLLLLILPTPTGLQHRLRLLRQLLALRPGMHR